MKKLPILSFFAVILSACGFAEPSSSSQGVQSSVSQSASSPVFSYFLLAAAFFFFIISFF